ncbi:MAG: hypothetical protein NTW21_39575 [Verrucomicrobia bacterium]|nr:hypothetical protein [Verrucomicrobiota bacterium]
MTKQHKTPIAPDIAQNMAQAETLFGVPKHIQKLAKSRGCDAFHGQRVHKKPLLAWVRKNAKLVAATVADLERTAASKSELAELKRQKMALEVAGLEFNLDKDKSKYTLTAAAQADWLTASAIYQEEAKSLMERDHFRIYVDRVHARLQALVNCQPPAQPARRNPV